MGGRIGYKLMSVYLTGGFRLRKDMALKKIIIIIFAIVFTLSMSACSSQSREQAPEQTQKPEINQSDDMVSAGTEEPETMEGDKILIAYFTRLDNTDASLDEIIQGGGPYGSVGTSLEDADVDALSSASITIRDGETQGNIQALAEMIQEVVGGNLFSIKTVDTYPVDYDTLIDQGGNEKRENIRPELASHVDDMADYDVVFIGFPNWWGDMPMAVYSFLEEYDFSGKKVIPFAASAGSGISNTIASISDLVPDADVESHGLHIPMRDVAGAKAQIEEWIEGLNIKP